MFDIINEIAVVGCALLMMAARIVWYDALFGAVRKEEGTGTTAYVAPLSTQLAGVFFSYVLALTLLAYGDAAASLFAVTPLLFALGVTAFVGALFASVVVTGAQSVRYFLIHFGFFAVFIISSVYLIHYWPW